VNDKQTNNVARLTFPDSCTNACLFTHLVLARLARNAAGGSNASTGRSDSSAAGHTSSRAVSRGVLKALSLNGRRSLLVGDRRDTRVEAVGVLNGAGWADGHFVGDLARSLADHLPPLLRGLRRVRLEGHLVVHGEGVAELALGHVLALNVELLATDGSDNAVEPL
jgi:hypothetical protein